MWRRPARESACVRARSKSRSHSGLHLFGRAQHYGELRSAGSDLFTAGAGRGECSLPHQHDLRWRKAPRTFPLATHYNRLDTPAAMVRQYTLQRHSTAGGPRIDFAAELNPQQSAAVMAPPGPALVIAGAGSGKTRTLTYRVAYLIENGIAPSNILLLTFTNKAAREMLDRVANLLPHDLTG